MEPNKLYFDVRDIFRAPRIALSGRKIWLFLKVNLFGYAIYWLFSYLAIVINGNNFLSSVEEFGLYPCLYTLDNPIILSLIVYWIGILIWLVAIISACTAVSRLTIQELKGNGLFSVADARDFAKAYRLSVLFSSISIFGIAAFFIFGFIIFALIGKIPFIGSILFALLYIAYFFGTIFIIYTIIVFVVSLFYSPSIVATMEEDTIGAVYQNYAITWSQPWRLIVYNAILFSLVILSVYIVKSLSVSAYAIINKLFGIELLMGEKVQNIVGCATDLITPWSLSSTGSLLLSLQAGTALSISEYISATILAIILLVIMFIIFSYGLAVLSVGETIIFTIIKMRSTGENLLERVEKDELLENDIELNSDVKTTE